MVSPLGLDVASSRAGILAGKSGAATIESFDVSDYSVQFAATMEGL